jgi:hypothetical protein
MHADRCNLTDPVRQDCKASPPCCLVSLREDFRVQQRGHFNTTRFWRWFECEAESLTAEIEGDCGAQCRLNDLQRHISGYDPDLVADVRRLPDLTCEISISGMDQRSAMVLVLAAPRISGWRISAPGATPATLRTTFGHVSTSSPPLAERAGVWHGLTYAQDRFNPAPPTVNGSRRGH